MAWVEQFAFQYAQRADVRTKVQNNREAVSLITSGWFSTSRGTDRITPCDWKSPAIYTKPAYAGFR